MRLLFALIALAAPAERGIPIPSSVTGIDGANLADTPLSNPINMEESSVCNQLSLTLAVMAGTSTRVQVQCYEAGTGEGFQAIPVCGGSNPGVCEPDIREFTFADYIPVGGVTWITTRWIATKKWMKCSVDDPDDGDGTVEVLGVRSWQ